MEEDQKGEHFDVSGENTYNMDKSVQKEDDNLVMEENSVPKPTVGDPVKESKDKKPKKVLLMLLGVLLFTSALGIGGYYLYNNYFSEEKPGSDKPTPTPASSLKPVQDLEKFQSEEEYKSYIKEGQSTMGMELFGSRQIAPATFDDVALSGPEEMSFNLSAGGGSDKSVYRVSDTNVQVKGIDEPDIVKTDGENIYYSAQGGYFRPIEPQPLLERDISTAIAPEYTKPNTKVLDAFPPEDLKELASIEESGEFLLSGNKLIVFTSEKLVAYDVSNPSESIKSWTLDLKDRNQVVTSRLMGDSIYLVTATYISSFDSCDIPVFTGASTVTVRCTDIHRPDRVFPVDSTYTVMKVNPENGEVTNTTSFVGNSSQSVVYMSPNAVYVSYTISEGYLNVYIDFFIDEGGKIFPESLIDRFKKVKEYDISYEAKFTEFSKILEDYQNSLSEDEELRIQNELENKLEDYIMSRSRELTQSGIAKIDINSFEVSSSGIFPGQPLNQFSMDEYQGNLRVATTVGGGMFGSETSANDVYVMDSGLNVIGEVKDLGLTERIYSVRFIQDKGYVVTFRQIDPFYVLDLSDPRSPQLKGELKIPGYSSYLHPIDDDNLIGVGKEGSNVKLSMFNVSNPENPLEVAKYDLDEYYSDVLNNHRAFLMDYENKIFFISGSRGGYVFSYANQTFSLERAVSNISAKRALFINDYLYVVGDEAVVVLNMDNWEEVNRLTY
ncbi:beta-propeller domain-containing protein [Candidatus Woesebacteria bacterium]|nr:beta-propeller domain-containing protein [Candidatus Woesebacteria bacterium]